MPDGACLGHGSNVTNPTPDENSKQQEAGSQPEQSPIEVVTIGGDVSSDTESAANTGFKAYGR